MPEETAKKTLSDDVLDFLSDVGAVEFAQSFVKKYKLADDRVGDVMNIAEDVARADVKLETLPEELSKQLGFDEPTAKKAAIEMAEARLLPIAESIGMNVGGQIEVWRGEKSRSLEVEKGDERSREVSPESFVHAFVELLPGNMPSHLENRLEHFLLSYVLKPSDRTHVVSEMMRAEKVGGLAFEEKDAESLLEYFDEKKAEVVFKKEIGGVEVGKAREAVEAIKAREALKSNVESIKIVEPIAIPSSVPPPSLRRGQGVVVKSMTPPDGMTPLDPPLAGPAAARAGGKSNTIIELEQDAREIEEIKIKKQAALEKPMGAPATIEETIANVCSIDAMRFEDQKLGDRCRQIVEARLREVRTASDTQNLIERSPDAGGLGVTGRKLSDMMQSIERAFDQFQKKFAEKVEDDKKQRVDANVAKDLAKQSLAEKEEKSMTKRYVALTGKIPDGHESPVSPSGARVSAATSSADALQSREQKIDTAKVRSAIESAKPVSTPSNSPSFFKEGAGGGRLSARPDMSDVKFVRRLSGPVDELRAMSLVDFRRLAKDPQASAEKIKGQVDLVEDQGYEKKVEAIKAWQSSPLYQMYLAITRAAMQEGISIEDARRAQEKNGESTLTKEEFSEILKLNSLLRF